MDISAMFAGAGWNGSQATVPVTDLSPHVDGGDGPVNAGSNGGTEDQRSILHGAAAVVLAAIALLWFFGGFAFRGLPSI